MKHPGRISCTAIALTMLVCAAIAGSRDVPTPTVMVAPPTFSAASQPLPAGLTLPPIEARRRVVGVVAADIDADGDLDVVVNDGSLDLAVWVNDGTGRLSRKRPARTRDWQAEPPAPSLEQRPAAAGAVLLNGMPSIGGDARAPLFALARAQRPLPLTTAHVTRIAAGTSSPRAPPSRS